LRSYIKRNESPFSYWSEVAVSFGLSIYWAYPAFTGN
jgi:hypothetical protein